MEPSLAAAFAQGDQKALGEIYELVGPLARNYLWMLTRDPETADDLVQEVFIMAHRDRKKLREPEKVVSWLMSIARNVGYTELRKRGRRREITFDDEESSGSALARQADESQANDPLELFASGERAAALQDAMALLRPKERDLIAMIYFLGMKQREAADAVGVSTGSVGTTLRRALDKMRLHLENAGLAMDDLL